MKWAARVFTAAIFALAILLAGLVVFSRTPTPPGEMVDVGGTRFRIDCSGPQNAALPTVIIESGASGLGLYYYWLQQELSQQVRTCSYDRAGTSWSDDNDEPHDAQHFSKQLHALLQKAGVKPPYVLAGHSLGGIIIRVYAGDYPSDVTGLVFLDSSHPDQVAKLPKPDGPAGSIETALLVQKLIQYAATVGLTHLYNPSAEALRSNEAFAALPRERQDLLIALTHRPQNYKGMREEYAGLEESFRQGGLVKTLGDVPLLAISAADAPKVPGVSAEWLRNFIVEVGKLHEDLATLSTRGRRIVLPGNHGSMVTEKTNAELVAGQILGMVHEAAEYRALR